MLLPTAAREGTAKEKQEQCKTEMCTKEYVWQTQLRKQNQDKLQDREVIHMMPK